MKQVWIVWGEAGSYDDYRKWIVGIFDNQAAADACAAAAQDWVNKNYRTLDLENMSFEESLLVKNPYDEKFDPWNCEDIEYTVDGPREVKSEFVPVT